MPSSYPLKGGCPNLHESSQKNETKNHFCLFLYTKSISSSFLSVSPTTGFPRNHFLPFWFRAFSSHTIFSGFWKYNSGDLSLEWWGWELEVTEGDVDDGAGGDLLLLLLLLGGDLPVGVSLQSSRNLGSASCSSATCHNISLFLFWCPVKLLHTMWFKVFLEDIEGNPEHKVPLPVILTWNFQKDW